MHARGIEMNATWSVAAIMGHPCCRVRRGRGRGREQRRKPKTRDRVELFAAAWFCLRPLTASIPRPRSIVGTFSSSFRRTLMF